MPQMPGTYAKIVLHVVFSTKGRAQMIKEPVQDRLYAYLGGIVRDERGVVMQAGGGLRRLLVVGAASCGSGLNG